MRSILSNLRNKIFRILLGRKIFDKINVQHTLDDINVSLEKLINQCAGIQVCINSIETSMQQNIREIETLKTLSLLKEKIPSVLHLLGARQISDNNEDNFVKTLMKRGGIFPNIRHDFKDLGRRLVIAYANNTNGIPLDDVQNTLLEITKHETLQEYGFFYLVERLMLSYKDDKKAKILCDTYSSLSFSNNIDTWYLSNGLLRYISYLLLRRESEMAEIVFKDNLSRFTNDEIAAWLPVAYLAHKNGIEDEDILFSSKLFEKFNAQNSREILAEYIKGKTMAIVGNGPQEIGTGKGAEIDSHDVVIRCNEAWKYLNDFSHDYGKKISILSNDGFSDKFINPYTTMYVFPTSMYFHFISKNVRQCIQMNPDAKIINLDISLYSEIRSLYNMHRSSSGLKIVYFFKKNLMHNIFSSDIYGFALNSGKVIEGKDYCTPEFYDPGQNDLNLELTVLRDIFK
jgi:hypothetical protein